LTGEIVAASLVMDRLVGMSGMATFLPFTLPKVLGYYEFAALNGGSMLAFSGAKSPEGSLARRMLSRARRILQRIWQAIIFWLRKPKTLLLPVLFNYGHVLFIFGMLWVILQGLDDPLTFLEVGGMWAAVYFITLLPISIGGLGLQEWAIWFVFHQIGGITEAHSLTLAILFRTLLMFSSLPGAAFVSGIMEKRTPIPPGEDDVSEE
jgi:hypothetical protein